MTSAPPDYFAALESLRDKLKAEPELVILFNDAIKGDDVRRLVDFGESLGIPVKYVALVDYSNSRGAIDMGVVPGEGGMRIHEMIAADLDVLWVVGANPYEGGAAAEGRDSSWCQDMFLTETAQLRGRGASGGERLREERDRHERHGRSAAAEARHQYHGREAGPGNHGLHRAGNGRGCGARSVVAADRCSKKFARTFTDTTLPCR